MGRRLCPSGKSLHKRKVELFHRTWPESSFLCQATERDEQPHSISLEHIPFFHLTQFLFTWLTPYPSSFPDPQRLDQVPRRLGAPETEVKSSVVIFTSQSVLPIAVRGIFTKPQSDHITPFVKCFNGSDFILIIITQIITWSLSRWSYNLSFKPGCLMSERGHC